MWVFSVFGTEQLSFERRRKIVGIILLATSMWLPFQVPLSYKLLLQFGHERSVPEGASTGRA